MKHRQITVEGVPIHTVDDGPLERPGILFLHGWPEDWSAFARIMESLNQELHVAAVDLPGIGQSPTRPASNDKLTLTRYVRGVIHALGLQNLTLVGHDIGGQIVYAYLHGYPDELRRAVIMNVAVPGVEPWSEVVSNPYIWHFAFHSIPDLPELLVQDHEAEYFAYFFDTISAHRDAVSSEARRLYVKAYSRVDALRTGFDWYRAFRQDQEANIRVREHLVRTPVLYLRGEAERGMPLERYVSGLRQNGLTAVEGAVIPGSGHFAPDERPEEVVSLLRAFVLREDAAGSLRR